MYRWTFDSFAVLRAGCESFAFLYMRYIPDDIANHLLKIKPPLSIECTGNVFLETIKRGEDDDFICCGSLATTKSPITTTVVLRLYEAFGGHSRIKLQIARHLPVVRAVVTNLLEDEDDCEELCVVCSGEGDDMTRSVKLDFRGFEVKTVKLHLRYTDWDQAE